MDYNTLFEKLQEHCDKTSLTRFRIERSRYLG